MKSAIVVLYWGDSPAMQSLGSVNSRLGRLAVALSSDLRQT